MWTDAAKQLPAPDVEVLVWVPAHQQALVGRYNYAEQCWEIVDWDDDDQEFYVFDAPWPIAFWQWIEPPTLFG